MRIFITGQKAFGAATLGLCLRRKHEIAGVSSPAWSRDEQRHDQLRAAAGAISVPWMPAGTLRADTLPEGVDLIVAAHSHDFIGRATRNKTRLGAIGYHPSLLPLHRGRDAVAWAIRMRERVTGGSVYWLSDGVDTGDVAAQEHVIIEPDDDERTLWRRELFPLGLILFDRVLADIEDGRLVKIPQRTKAATWEPAIGRVPLFKPELPQLGQIVGFEVVRVGRQLVE